LSIVILITLQFPLNLITGTDLCFKMKYYFQFSATYKKESFRSQESETII